MKRFFDRANAVIPSLLPSAVIQNLRTVLLEMANVLEGEFFTSSEIVCLRNTQFLHQRDPR